jgi:hypothetical protein
MPERIQFKSDWKRYENSIDVCCITESWLSFNISTDSISIDGYVCQRRGRSDAIKAAVFCVMYEMNVHVFVLVQ